MPDLNGRPKVLHVRVVRGHGGGPERSIFGSAAKLADEFAVHAAYLHPTDDPDIDAVRARARAAGCSLECFPDRGPIDVRCAERLLSHCRRLGVRLWHGHDYKSNALGLLLRRRHPMKLVTTLHGWVEFTARTRLYYALDRRLLRYYDHVIAVSSDLVTAAANAGVAAERTSLLPNGVDLDMFSPARTPDSVGGRVGNGPVVGALGRLSDEKGFDALLQTFADLPADLDRSRLWIAGDGPARARLRALIDDLGLRDRARLLGHVEDPAEFYRSIDVFALPSLREGLPHALLEAMACAVPVVASAVNGVPSVVRHEVTGLLVEPGDRQALGSNLTRLLTDSSLRHDLGRAGRDWVATHHTYGARAAAEAAIYRRMLATSV